MNRPDNWKCSRCGKVEKKSKPKQRIYKEIAWGILLVVIAMIGTLIWFGFLV